MNDIDAHGHLFAGSRGGLFCLGCACTPTAPEALRRCPDADGLQADVDAAAILARWPVLVLAPLSTPASAWPTNQHVQSQ